jgi:hypothetical protein
MDEIEIEQRSSQGRKIDFEKHLVSLDIISK